MDLSLQEKSRWLVLISLTVVYGLYFAAVLPTQSPDVLPQHVVIFTGLVVLLVLLQIVGHALLAIVDRRHESDERDRLIVLVGTRNGSLVLATGVFFALSLALVTEGDFLFTHVLLAFWVLAHLVDLGTQLWLYRKGV